MVTAQITQPLHISFLGPNGVSPPGTTVQKRPKSKRTRRGKMKRLTEPSMDPIPIPGKKLAVVNLSNTALTPAQLSVLELGLSFVPTPSVGQFELFWDLHNVFRNVRCNFFLMNNEPSHNNVHKSTFYIKSSFCPKNINHLIDTQCRLIELEKYIKQKTFTSHNLTDD